MRARGGRAAMPRPFPLFALGPLLALYLKQADFVSLYVCYLFPPNLCRLFAQAVSRLLRGTHRFFALPEGYPKRLAAVAVDEGDHALEALHQPPHGKTTSLAWRTLTSENSSYEEFVNGPSANRVSRKSTSCRAPVQHL